MFWTTSNVLRFIELYKDRKVLWDYQHKSYTLTSKKQEAWMEISAELDADVDELKRKMNALLATYRKLRQKVSKNKWGADDADQFISWFAYESFSFLHDRYKPRRINYPETVDQNNDGTEADEDENKIWLRMEEDDDIFKDLKDECIEDNTQTSQSHDKLFMSAKHIPRKRVREEYDNYEIGEAARSNAINTRDEFDAYGEFIARKLRSLDKRACAYVQKSFGDILFNADIGSFSGNKTEPYDPELNAE